MGLNSPASTFTETGNLTRYQTTKFFDWSKLKQIADDILKCIYGRKHCEKRRNCLLQAISPFLTMFSKSMYAALCDNGLKCGIVL